MTLAEGIWPAFWLLPVHNLNWPVDGEVDICETWNGQHENGACLHWGHFTPEDSAKHRVLKLPVPAMDQEHSYGFAWHGRRLVWFIDGYPTMRAVLPDTCRDIREFNIILNVAMGGNVMGGIKPDPGCYDMVIRNLAIWDAPGFDGAWDVAREGNSM